ncbi:MAG TPA: hypothetical protein VEL76_36845 [Gemmataceae bacterium]|nr:hypothetical protein [Gemmataceae bacterium]
MTMAPPKDPQELALVVLAISCGVGGCCEWDDKAARRFRSSPPLANLLPEGVKDLLVEYISAGGEVVQVEETRAEYNDRPFYYKVILPLTGLRHGLFIEIVLDDADPDLPTIRIVNCHAQNR